MIIFHLCKEFMKTLFSASRYGIMSEELARSKNLAYKWKASKEGIHYVSRIDYYAGI